MERSNPKESTRNYARECIQAEQRLSAVKAVYQALSERLFFKKSTGFFSRVTEQLLSTKQSNSDLPNVSELQRFIRLVKNIQPEYLPSVQLKQDFAQLERVSQLLIQAMQFKPLLEQLEQEVEPAFERSALITADEKVKQLCAQYAVSDVQMYLREGGVEDAEHPLNKRALDEKIKALKEKIAFKQCIILPLERSVEKVLTTVEKEWPSEDLNRVELEQALPPGWQALHQHNIQLCLDRIERLKQEILTAKREAYQQHYGNYIAQQQRIQRAQDVHQAYQQDKLGCQHLWTVEERCFEVMEQYYQEGKRFISDWPSCAKVELMPAVSKPAYQQLMQRSYEKMYAEIEDNLRHSESDYRLINFKLCRLCRMLAQFQMDELYLKLEPLFVKLFIKAHFAERAQQWFPWLRFSYWSGRMTSQLSWKNIANHAQHGAVGYTGFRTQQLLLQLGWLEPSGKIPEWLFFLQQPKQEQYDEDALYRF